MSAVLTSAPQHAPSATQHGCALVFASTAEAAKSIAANESSARRIVLGAQPGPGCEALDSYLCRDWEYRLISSFGPAARNWHRRNSGEALFLLDQIDLAESGRFSFLTRVVLEKGRTLAAISGALVAVAAAEVYCDAALAPYLRVLFDGPLHVCNGNGEALAPTCRKAPAINWRNILRELVLGLGYKLLSAVAISRWRQWRASHRIPGSQPVFIGSEHGLKNLEPFFAVVNRPINLLRPVGQLGRNRGLADSKIDWRLTYLESLLRPVEAIRVAQHSLRIAQWFRKTWDETGFRDLLIWNERDCLSLFAPEFARFVLAHSVGAVRNHHIARTLIRKHRPARVFFDNPNAWEFSVMVEHLRRTAIPTVGFVNGLVQDIIPFRCAVDTLLTAGEWDQRLLQPVMSGTDVVAYGNPTQARTNGERENLLIVSSSCRDHANRQAFVRVVAEFIDQHVRDDDFSEIVLKLHPYEDPKAMGRYFAEFPRVAARLRITRQALDVELSRARLAICLLSTVIRDLAWDSTPFLLFDSVEWPMHTFYSQIPESVRFTSATELAMKAADLDTLRNESVRVRKLYFGHPTPNGFALLRFHLLGESD